MARHSGPQHAAMGWLSWGVRSDDDEEKPPWPHWRVVHSFGVSWHAFDHSDLVV